MRKRLFLQALIVLCVVIGVAFFLIRDNRSQLAFPKKFLFPSISPIPTIEKSSEEVISLPGELSVTLKNVFNEEVTYETNGTVPFYIERFDKNAPAIVIVAYKYTAGSVLEEGYEGFRWTRKFDDEVKEFQSLSPGIHTAIVHGPSVAGDGFERDVSVISLGNRKYAYYTSSFAPAGTFGRTYYTFDEKTQQLIFIELSFYGPGEDRKKIIETGGFESLPEYQDIFNVFEQKLLAL